MAEVFISYAREDQGFARDLKAALEKLQREAWIDWRNIPDSAQWRKEIFDAIEAADNFLFIISPDSLRSWMCGQEVAHAVANRKRTVTILYHPVNHDELLPGLKEIQWINYPELGFEPAFLRLISAIDTDLDFVRGHTRWESRAKEWESRDRNDDYLLPGELLREATEWLEKAKKVKSPNPTESLKQYISASQEKKTRELQRYRELTERLEAEREQQEQGQQSLFREKQEAQRNVLQYKPEEILREAILRKIQYDLVRPVSELAPADYLQPVSLALRDRLIDRMFESDARYRHRKLKRLYYVSTEWPMGQPLRNVISGLRIEEVCKIVLGGLNVSLPEVLDSEPDLGFAGNHEVVADSFLESMATLGIPSFGYGIHQEGKLFQKVTASHVQRERLAPVSSSSNPLQIQHPEDTLSIPVYGHLDLKSDDADISRNRWTGFNIILGTPGDMPIVGYLGFTVTWLRLFTAAADFDIDVTSDSAASELSLLENYFLVACAIGDIIRRFRQEHADFDLLPSKIAIHLAGTQASLAIPELMRILLDLYSVSWDNALEITRRTITYTTREMPSDVPAQWPVSLLERVIPRHLQIIYRINHDFLSSLYGPFSDAEKLRRISLVEEGSEKKVRRSHLGIVGSHSVNGVSRRQTELLIGSLFPDLAELWPERFNNKTDGVTQRRWLTQTNPGLTDLISQTLDEQKWFTDLNRLRDLEPFSDDEGFRQAFKEVRFQNKSRLAKTLQKLTGVVLAPESIFDVHLAPIRGHKRQLLNVMRIVYDYLRIMDHKELSLVPRSYIIAGVVDPECASGTRISTLIQNVARVVNSEWNAQGLIKVIYLPNCPISLTQTIVSAADLSEQISTVGTEAFGDAGVKLAMNGAIINGTWDGANIEIAEEVGFENIYIFGLRAEEILELQRNGSYNPRERYDNDPVIREVMDALFSDRFSLGSHGLFKWVFDELLYRDDKYFHVADFPSFVEVQDSIAGDYQRGSIWWRKSILNVARIGKFSSDRTVLEYARDLWHIGPYDRANSRKDAIV